VAAPKRKAAAKRPSKKSGGYSIRAYALHRKKLGLSGGSAASVQKALNAGRISRGPDGKIHPEVADQEWERNSDASKRPKTLSISAAKAVREEYLAKMARLDYLERAGDLVSAARVRKERFEDGRSTREAILAAAARCAADAYAAKSVGDCESIILAELRTTLERLADGGGE